MLTLPMGEADARETAKLIEAIAQHMTPANWHKLAKDFNNPVKRGIALKYMRN